ncbi:MAG: hypothetical protein K2X77_12780 [Candidatus Obscuribacterales bacterium]|nr:hypothetical protein [Candidatus Obscuribacterales bacterium]
MTASEVQIAELSFDESKQLDLSFLLSGKWWSSTLKLVFSVMRHFVVVAFLFGWSNAFTAYADYSLTNSGLDFTVVDLPALTNLGMKLAISTVVALVLGLVSLSILLEKLTALARLYLLKRAPSQFVATKKEVDARKGYIAGVWMVGVLYLLLPLIPASVCLAFKILSNSQLYVMGEPIIQIPETARIPMNVAEAMLFAISIAYCIVLTVVSSALCIKATKAAKIGALLMLNQAGRLMIATLLVAIINALLSAPLSIYLAYLAPLEQKKDLPLIIVSQLWFGISSAFVWPLSMLVFAELLEKNFSQAKPPENSISSPGNSQE